MQSCGHFQEFQKKLLFLHHISRKSASPWSDHPTPHCRRSCCSHPPGCRPWRHNSAIWTCYKLQWMMSPFPWVQGALWQSSGNGCMIDNIKRSFWDQNVVFLKQSRCRFLWKNFLTLISFQTDDFLLGFFKCKVTAIKKKMLCLSALLPLPAPHFLWIEKFSPLC